MATSISNSGKENKIVDPKTIRNAIGALFAAWNRPGPPAATFLAFEMALGDLTAEQVTAAVAMAVRRGGEYPPSAGQLRAIAIGRTDDDLRALAYEAFNRADQLARTVGRNANPRRLDDPLLTHALGAVGGWTSFCGKVDHWQERSFVTAYIDAASNPALEEVARLSHDGKPLGALQDHRRSMADQLALP